MPRSRGPRRSMPGRTGRSRGGSHHPRRGTAPPGEDARLLPLPPGVVLVEFPGEANGLLAAVRNEDLALREASPTRPAAFSRGPTRKARSSSVAVPWGMPAAAKSASTPGRGPFRISRSPSRTSRRLRPGGGHVRHRAQRHEVEIPAERWLRAAVEESAPAKPFPHGARKEEGDPHPGHLLAGERAVGLLRVHHGVGGRHGIPRKVVVGDDHLDTLPGRLRTAAASEMPQSTDTASRYPSRANRARSWPGDRTRPAPVVLVDPHGEAGKQFPQDEVEAAAPVAPSAS